MFHCSCSSIDGNNSCEKPLNATMTQSYSGVWCGIIHIFIIKLNTIKGSKIEAMFVGKRIYNHIFCLYYTTVAIITTLCCVTFCLLMLCTCVLEFLILWLHTCASQLCRWLQCYCCLVPVTALGSNYFTHLIIQRNGTTANVTNTQMF